MNEMSFEIIFYEFSMFKTIDLETSFQPLICIFNYNSISMFLSNLYQFI
mgnify:CR=1 FL=1